MPGLLSLPNELINEIADEIDASNLKTFWGTCRRINAVVSHRFFAHITIDIHKKRRNIGVSKLEALATGSTCAAEYVRAIRIRRLAPDYDPTLGYRIFKTTIRAPTDTSDQRKNQKMDLVQEKICKLMPEALSALKGVKTVVSINPEWASILVLDFLALAPGIKNINFLRGDSDVLATKFFTQVLPRLSETLVSLRISASFEGLWCFGQHNVDILLECKQLVELTIPVYASEGDAGVLPCGSYQNLGRILNQIMNMVAQMPNLCRLGLLSAKREELKFGNTAMVNLRVTYQVLCELMALFGPVQPAVHPSLVTIGVAIGGKFRPQCGADGIVKYVKLSED